MSSFSPPDWGDTLQDATPIHVPSSPPSVEVPGDITPGFAAPAPAVCPVCLEPPAAGPNAHEITYPCCGAFTHLGCLVQAARLHGRCPNCRADVRHLPREPSIAARCHELGVDLDPAPTRDRGALHIPKCATMRRARSLALTPQSLPSPFTFVPSVAAAWLGPLLGSPSCRTAVCTGRQCPAVGPMAFPAGLPCGSACVALTSCRGSAFKSPARPPPARGVTCPCCGRST